MGAAAVSAFGMISTAPASAYWTNCSSSYACMWQPTQYAGSPNAQFQGSVQLVASNNKINSVSNNGVSSIAAFYDAANCSGVRIT